MNLTVPEDSLEEVLDFLKNAILDAMSAENTRQSGARSSSHPEDAAERASGGPEAEGPDGEMSLPALLRMLEEELVTDAEDLYRVLPENAMAHCERQSLRYGLS
ncbi:unnamed protein product [Ixodes persulcatus]